MPSSFIPSGIKSLAEIDVAEGVSYQSQPVVIQGVVSPKSQGGWPGESSSYNVHSFTLAAWHPSGEPVQRRELLVLRPLPTDEDDYFDDFPAYSIQRFRVLISKDGERSVLEEVLLPEEPDEQLYAIADEVKKPVVVPTDTFGNLTLDRRINWFEGEAEWNGDVVGVRFAAAEDRPLEGALQAADSLWSNQPKWTKRIEDFVIEKLLRLKNEDWIEEGEAALTREEFLARMSLESISFDRHGDWEFSYYDGDLFGGHLICVRGNASRGVISAGLQG